MLDQDCAHPLQILIHCDGLEVVRRRGLSPQESGTQAGTRAGTQAGTQTGTWLRQRAAREHLLCREGVLGCWRGPLWGLEAGRVGCAWDLVAACLKSQASSDIRNRVHCESFGPCINKLQRRQCDVITAESNYTTATSPRAITKLHVVAFLTHCQGKAAVVMDIAFKCS